MSLKFCSEMTPVKGTVETVFLFQTRTQDCPSVVQTPDNTVASPANSSIGDSQNKNSLTHFLDKFV